MNLEETVVYEGRFHGNEYELTIDDLNFTYDTTEWSHEERQGLGSSDSRINDMQSNGDLEFQEILGISTDLLSDHA